MLNRYLFGTLLRAGSLSILLFLASSDLPAENATPIDRHALVTRHNITLNDPAKHLPLGNGEFSFGADGTGLQTFAGNCMSHWGWHSFPLPEGWTPDRVPSTGTFQKGRNIGPTILTPQAPMPFVPGCATIPTS